MTLYPRTPDLALILLAFALVLLQSCAPVTTTKTTERPAAEPAVPTAEQAERSGDYVRAAEEYEKVAETAELEERQTLQLKAVETLVKAGQLHEAREKIEEIKIAALDPNLRARKQIIEAQIASQVGTPEEAIRLLDEVQRARNLDPSLLAALYRARADAEVGLGDPIGAVKNLIVREQYIVGKEAITDNQLQLWEILNSLPRATLKDELRPGTHPVLAGWIELAIEAIENAGRAGLLAKSISVWKTTHPGHPALESLLEQLASAEPGLIGRIENIALLLPLSSSYAIAAEAVRDGFLAMDVANTDPDKPRIRIYDIGDDPKRAAEFYTQATAEGAQLIIGPLGRDAVEQVVQQTDLTVPTLLLGHTGVNENPLPGYAFQFGLPPEQEARQVAERAYLDGHRQAAVLYPDTGWGKRMLKAFANHWQQLGGILLTTVPYKPNQSDHSGSIKELLNITQSEARKRTLEARLGTRLKFQSRRREDVDFIFLAADAKPGRLIKPQLNFHRGLNIPVYSTSHIFSGKIDRVRDRDLEGIMFGDMPWMLVRDGKLEEIRKNLQGDWPYAHTQLDRLFALGVDSYAIIPYLNRIRSNYAARFSGVTSGLSLGREGRLHRQLLWAKFRRGSPRLLDGFISYTGQFQHIESDSEKARTPRPRS
ncbi:MAG: penicillin-binding protein activator [Acidiferrobacterales bacterium]